MKPSDLDPERWRRIDAVLGAALETPPDERPAFLASACADDHALRSDVEALLEAHARAGPRFDEPASLLDEALEALAPNDVEGRQVGPFRLVREIGRGGMGVVYLAEDTRLGRRVALKVLPPYLGVGRQAKRRFMSEARAIAALDHPNIATLYETDETEEGQLYMAFALYEGETLDELIRRGPLPVERVVEIATQIAAGLHEAHDSEIVHRDVKPSNVLLTERGEVKLLDFGVAKAAGEDVTQEGVRPGTVAYMSPEQATGARLDGRTDLWSLGVVLYEMLTGVRPFWEDDQASLIQKILHADPDPPSSLRSDLPEDVAWVVDKLLCKTPDGRYRSAEDLLDDLRSLRRGGSPDVAIREPPPAVGRGRRVPSGAAVWRALRRPTVAVPAVVAVLAGGIWLSTRPPSGQGPRIERLAVLPLTNLTGDAEHQHIVNGVHDALIAELGKIGSLGVISRTSVARYRNTDAPIPEIARELEVDALVEGSVIMDGDSIAITATLVEASPERQLWTASYRSPLGGVYEVSSEVALSIAEELGIELTRDEGARLAAGGPVDPEAYDAFALGQFNVELRSREGFELARRYFRQAIEIDSTFAPAYAALAEAYGSAAFFGLGRPSEVMPRVTELARAALRFDSTNAHAHNVLAAVQFYWEWDWDESERLARRAIELNPSRAGYFLAEVLSVAGRYAEALAVVERGASLDRMVPFASFRPVVVLNYMRDFDQAIELSRAGLQFFPDFWQGHWLLCQALAGKGLYDSAAEACEEATRLSDRLPMALGALGYAYARAGRRADAELLVAELEQRADAAYVGGTHIAIVFGALGDRDRAFAWLDRAYEERDVALVHLDVNPAFDPLRSDARFDVLLERIGLERR
ncbi:MAG: protein kinase [Gemmatimonadota bacterium]